VTRVTAVILSYNRQDALRRQLLYYANKPVHLIFADGSEEDWGSGEYGSIGEMTWEYFRISGFYSFVARLKMATSLIQTEFVYYIDDEDCILWSGVLKAIDFLRDHPDHSVAGGRYDKLTFDRRLRILPSVSFSSKFELLQDDGLKRFELLCKENRTINLYYQVMRRTSLQAFSDALDPNNSFEGKMSGFGEIATSGYLAISGKWQYGEYPFLLRFSILGQHSWIGNKNLIDEDAKELAELIMTACANSNEFDKSLGFNAQESIVEICKQCYGLDAVFSKKNNRLRLSLKFKQLTTRLGYPGRVLFNILLKIFICFRGETPKRLEKYARMYQNESPLIRDEMELVEKLWSRYPKGLTNSQFEEELALLCRSGA